MGYIKVDFEELLLKTWRDCTKDFWYLIPMIVSVLIPIISLGVLFKFFVNFNFYFLVLACLLFVISFVFQTWYFTTAKIISHGMAFKFLSSFSESLPQFPRLVGTYLVWMILFLLTLAIMIVFMGVTYGLFQISALYGLISLIITIPVVIVCLILMVIYIFANVYLMQALFLEKAMPFYKIPFFAIKYCLNKKLETFVFLLIMMVFIYVAMIPTYLFNILDKSAISAIGNTATFQQVLQSLSDVYLNPLYIILLLPVFLVSIYSIVAMFNLYIMQRQKINEYGNTEIVVLKKDMKTQEPKKEKPKKAVTKKKTKHKTSKKKKR